MGIILGIAVADPDLQRRRGPGHPDPEISVGGGGQSPKILTLWASVWSKNKGWGGGPGSSEFPFQQLTFCTLQIGTSKSFPVIINTTHVIDRVCILLSSSNSMTFSMTFPSFL